MRAIEIPSTSPTRYISFKHALNLRRADEDTGDWHFETAFFDEDGVDRRVAPVAGEGGLVDTWPSLGAKGIRDMGDVLRRQGVTDRPGAIYAADHFRAVADLVMLELVDRVSPTIAGSDAINAWFDTQAQIDRLVSDFLQPLRGQIDGGAAEVFDRWIMTVAFD